MPGDARIDTSDEEALRPVWSPDGGVLYFVTPDGELSQREPPVED